MRGTSQPLKGIECFNKAYEYGIRRVEYTALKTRGKASVTRSRLEERKRYGDGSLTGADWLPHGSRYCSGMPDHGVPAVVTAPGLARAPKRTEICRSVGPATESSHLFI